ncbi:Bax inhibitor-1 family protein [Sandaracinus amylolyticus]|uniref:Bax inhibitor-1/YccA family protein n=1 Tax=Sandaracinus amylolyticus TaxID=927083 RepID=UPI001F1C2802|nr:Bax inhibitor-1 family protein [Sandaracinus amylolyticus]UJR81240.1 Inhibitor of apoptosis-promoting Bax1 [Sandaracinus amylolyticus]
MQQSFDGYAGGFTAAQASVEDRAGFIFRTYVHLVGAIFAFVFLEAALFMTGIAQMVSETILGTGRLGWLVVLGGFIAVSWIADKWARSDAGQAMQYAGLGLYVVAEAVIFMPLLYLATLIDPSAIPTAGLVTLVLFGGLTGIVFLTRHDFSFLRGILGVAALGAFGVIICSALFGFSLGVLFSGAMVVLAGGYILYYTSSVLHHYRVDQHVAAALALFSSVALLFWYVLRIFLASRR